MKRKVIIYMLFGAALTLVSGCSSLMGKSHLTTDGALVAQPAVISVRPHEMGLEPVGDAKGSASTEKFLGFTIGGDKPSDLSMPVLGNGAKGALETLACFRAVQPTDGDAFYSVTTTWDKKNILGIYRKYSVTVTGKSLKIKDMGHVSAERADKAAKRETRTKPVQTGILSLFSGDEGESRRLDQLYFGAGLYGVNSPEISSSGLPSGFNVEPGFQGFIGYGIFPWLAIEGRGALWAGYTEMTGPPPHHSTEFRMNAATFDGVIKPKYATRNFALYGILGVSVVMTDLEVESYGTGAYSEHFSDSHGGLVVGAGVTYGWNWFALNADICTYNYSDDFEVDPIVNVGVVFDL